MSSADDAKRAAEGAPPIPIPGERRQVSVLFADMVGYTAIVERLGEEKALVFVRMIYDKLTGAVRGHGGSVRGFAGDSVVAVFGVPEAQEDAALRACRTALAIHAAFAAAADEIEARFGERPVIRAGVSSGIAVMAPVEGEGAEPTAVGDTVNRASRLQNLAPPGGTMICDATRRLVEWFVDASFEGERPIKGRSKPQKIWRLNSVRRGVTRFDASLGRGLSPYVGRHDELARLRHALALSKVRRHVIDIAAEPGLGKTRLVFEFLQQLKNDEAFVLTGHCAADGQQVPFLPFLEVVRNAFRIWQDDPAEIAHKIDAGLRALELHSAENLGLLPPRSFKSSAVRLGKRSPSIALSRNAASYCPRPRFLSQAATSKVASTQWDGIIAPAPWSVRRAPFPAAVERGPMSVSLTYAFGRRPLSSPSHPFIGPILKGSKGSRVRIAGTTPRGDVCDTREAAPSSRARLAPTASEHDRPRSQDNGPCSRSSYVRELIGLRADCRSCDRSAPPWCGEANEYHGAAVHSRAPDPATHDARVLARRAPSGEVDCGLGSERGTDLDLRVALSTNLAAKRGSVP
jgi:class 3 adenylate cyclase